REAQRQKVPAVPSRALADRTLRKGRVGLFPAQRLRKLGQEHRQPVLELMAGRRRPGARADSQSRLRDDRLPVGRHELVQHGLPPWTTPRSATARAWVSQDDAPAEYVER